MLLNQVASVVGIVVLVWLVVLSFLLYRTIAHYRRLTTGVIKGDLSSVLEKILDGQTATGRRIEEIIKKAEKLEGDGRTHVQKIGLVRFNPFAETGGNQSFALAVLDGTHSGVVICSLHGRDSTRVYTKTVKAGKGEGYKFSKEELEAIEKACKD